MILDIFYTIRRSHVLLYSIMLFCAMLLVSTNSYAQFTITDDFRNQGSADIIVGGPGGTGGTAYFTSGVDDPVGAGWLRLTKALGNQRGFAYINRSFPSTLGLLIDFEYKMWRSSADGYNGADGMSFFLFDANVPTFRLGGYGGSLGYAPQGAVTPQGVAGGYIGVGLDAYGNFARAVEGRIGGPGFAPNAITIRGATTDDAATTNPYLTHAEVGDRTGSVDDIRRRDEIDYNTTTATRPSDQTFYRRVQLEIIPTTTGQYRIVVRWKKNPTDVNFTQLINYTSDQVPPSLLKLGFAASTGGGFNNHELRNLLITTPNNLRVTKRANKDVLRRIATNNANQITYTIEVVNDTDQAYTNASFEDQLMDIYGNAIPTSMFAITPASITTTGFTNINITPVSGQNKITGNLTIAPHTTGTITVTGTLSQIPPSNVLVNKVSVLPTGNDADFDLGNNTAIVNTPVIAEGVDLLLQKTTIGDPCIDFTTGNTHELRVVNMGTTAATYRRTGNSSSNNKNRIVITKVYPSNYEYNDSATPGGFYTDLNTTSNGDPARRWTKIVQTNTPSTGYTTLTYIARGADDSDQTLAGGGNGNLMPYPIRYTIKPPVGTTSFVDEARVEYRSANGNIAYNGSNIEASYSPPNTANNTHSETIYATPPVPTIPSSKIYYYVGDVATQLTATPLPGNTLKWYLNIGGTSATVAPTPFTNAVGTTRYYVSQTNGSCEGPMATIDVVVNRREADLYTDIQYAVGGIPNATKGVKGNAVQYQVTAGNIGPQAADGAKFTFTVPPGVDVTNPGTISFTTSCSGGTVTQAAPLTYNATKRTFSSTLNLPAGCSITYTVNGVLNGYHGAVIAESTILRPRYIYDVDATSDLLAVPTNPYTECNAGTAGCNNIQEKAFLVEPECIDEVMYFEDFGRGDLNVNSGRQSWNGMASAKITSGEIQMNADGSFAREGSIGQATAAYSFAPAFNDPLYPAALAIQPLVSRILRGYYAVVAPGYTQLGIPEDDPWRVGTWDPAAVNLDIYDLNGNYDWTQSWEKSNAVRDMSGAINGNAFLIRGAASASQSIRPFYEFDLPEKIQQNRTYTLDIFSYVTYHDKDYMLMDVIDKNTGHIYVSVPLKYPEETLPPEANPTGVSFGWIPLSASFSFADGSCGDFSEKDIKIAIRGSQNRALETGKGFGHTLIDNITFSKRQEGEACAVETKTISCSDNCAADVEGEGYEWYYNGDAPSNPVVKEFTQPATNQGFVLDIYKLDNSFNMKINGVALYSEEIEFQNDRPRNIRFKSDKARWGTGGVSEVWSLNSGATIDLDDRFNNPTPAVRVTIDQFGNIGLYGKRTTTSELEELELFDRATSQAVSPSNIFWYTEGTGNDINKINVSQDVNGQTRMSVFGYGLNWKECETCTIEKDGVFNDSNDDGYAHRGETITYTFDVKNLGDLEIHDIVITDPLFGFNITLDASHQPVPSNVTLTGDANNNGILDRNETWKFTVDYPVTNEDIFTNKGVYNRAKVTGVGVLPNSTIQADVDSTDPTPYKEGDEGWDPTKPFHTYVPLKGLGLLITNPMIRQRTQ